MDKWEYIRNISQSSDKVGNLLIELMAMNNKNSLREITLEEAEAFWNRISNN